MMNLERQEKALLIILIAALLLGAGILAYKKSCPVGSLRIEYSGPATRPPATEIIKKGGAININKASADELARLNGIGPMLAGRIIDYRTNRGLFLSPDDLKKVPGIGNAIFEKIKDEITIE